MLKHHLVSQISRDANVSAETAEWMLDTVLTGIKKGVREDAESIVRLPKFGTFRIREFDGKKKFILNPDLSAYPELGVTDHV